MYIYNNIKVFLFGLIFLSFSLAQDADTTSVAQEVEEEGSGREMYTSVDVSYSEDKGNTDFLSLYYGFNFVLLGDLGPLNDTEFLFDFNRSDDQLDGEPFTDDQALTLKFDLWANQRFSPFLFYQNSFDKTIGLENRINYGVGGKIGLIKGFSISYAFLSESESYEEYDYWLYDSSATDTNSADWDGWWDANYYEPDNPDALGDTVFYSYRDSVMLIQGGTTDFYRHSIRPKFKIKLFDESLVFDYRFYYKPKVNNFDDYLLEHELTVSIATFYEALTIDLNYTNKYNSRYDGTNIINPEVGSAYKPVDENLTIGFSFML